MKILTIYLSIFLNVAYVKTGQTTAPVVVSVDPSKVFFMHYEGGTSENPSAKMFEINFTRTYTINVSCKTIFIDHGWLGSCNAAVPTVIKNAYVEVAYKSGQCYNLFLLDNSFYAGTTYEAAAAALPHVGQLQGDFIVKLIKDGKLKLDDLVVVGHSFGAQIAAFSCNRIYEVLKRKCPVIHGLDPAAFLFDTNPPDKRLSKSSAKCTTGIYTSSSGYNQNLVSRNYVYNGSDKLQRLQCYNANVTFTNFLSGSCAHSLSAQLYANSVLNPRKYPAAFCLNYENAYWNHLCTKLLNVNMGVRGCETLEGSYYVAPVLD